MLICPALPFQHTVPGTDCPARVLFLCLQLVAIMQKVRMTGEDEPFNTEERAVMHITAGLMTPRMAVCPDIRDPVTLLYACAQERFWHLPLLGAVCNSLMQGNARLLREQGNGFR